MIDILEKVIDKINISPKDFIDLRYSRTESESFNVTNGRFDSVSNQTTGGVAIRALVGNAWGFTSTVKIDVDEILKGIKKAISMAEVASKYAKEERRISDKWVYEGKGATKMITDPREIDKEIKLEKVMKTEEAARNYSEKVAQSSSIYNESHKYECVVNSIGTKVENEYHVIRLMKNVVGREGTKMQNVFDSIGGAGGWELIEKWNPVEEGEKAAEQAVKLLNAISPPSGKMNIIMDPSLSGVFIHEAFGHASEADGVFARNSVLEGKIGKKIGKEGINVYDDPTIEGLRGSFAYDSEGTKTRKRTIVEKGVLLEYLHTLETATMMDMEPNGAGRAMTFNFIPIPRMSNTYIGAGDMSLEEIAELTKEGVYLKDSYGGYVHPTKGEFYFTCQYGYIIKDGKIEDMFGNVGMSGMTLEVLNNAYGIGKEWKPAFLGTCGKGGQWVPVTGGGPNLGVSNLVVGGK